MKYTNSFFQLDIRENGVYVHIYPAKEGGKKIVIQEFAEYLEKCGIHEYNLSQLNTAIEKAKEEVDLFVTSNVISEVNEMAKVRVTDDKMMAIIRFYPPSKNGKYMTEKDIHNELARLNITNGISAKVIKAYTMGQQFCRDIPVAKGTPVVQGKDAQVIYKFETSPTAKPKLLEDGSVDFHELNLFTSVKAGDLLAEMIPEVQGTEGVDVYGNVVPPVRVKPKALKHGRNIRMSEDKTKIYSEVDGDVKLEGDTVFVSDTYTVPADVDTSTGDIHYNGNVYVAGNVRSGFTIEATGDVEINGVVEGARIVSGGNIVMKRGVQGMGKGYLEAKHDIVTKFLESCTVKAGNTINTGSSLHSDLTAGDKVIVSGRKGFLIGGTISAGKRIEASVFGNKMNTTTTLKVGVEPEVMERFKELTTTIKEHQDELLEHKQVLETLKKKMAEGLKLLPNQMVMAKQSGEAIKTINEALEAESSEYMLLKKLIEENTGGKIVVNHTIFPGVCICISNRIHPIKDVRSRCQFRADGADVVSTPI
ncbi:MAG: DUF342 domain-containing protein [Lachnospiraceae bacterium]|nr:DUF342 domain-containing protein [Lachnospiraceae bacterium]